MRVITLAGGFDKNLTYLAASDGRSDAVLVDAAVGAEEILASLEEHGLRLACLVLTHGHQDHWWSAQEVLERTGAALAAYEGSAALSDLVAPRTLALADGEVLDEAGLRLQALFTPGHAPDHICLYEQTASVLFTGDALFVGRTGRTASPSQDARTLYRSLRDKLATIPDAVTFYPGHDYGPVPSRTLGEERAQNRWLQAQDEDEFVRVMDAYEASRR
jgi:glyoxylase-like metal-dependent hydrolase (beta-lactamase superfamily II)